MKKNIALFMIVISSVALIIIFCIKNVNLDNIEILQHDIKPPSLLWYQIGRQPKDFDIVLDDVNKYIYEQLGINLEIQYINWSEYNERMATIINSGEAYDMTFASSWTNSYLENSEKGNFIALDKLLSEYGKEMLSAIDESFWNGVKVNDVIHGVPTQKEISNVPMWVFTKEYVDKYNIPYKTIHTLEDLEPWLELIKTNEAEVIPFYVNEDYSIPSNFDQIVESIGISYLDDSLKVKNFFETDEVINNLRVMSYYYSKGYINKDAALTTATNDTKIFVFKADGQPYAENIWSKDLGYPVVASNISEPIVSNSSTKGAITSISKTSKYPEKSIKFLNLVNTDKYLRNLLNYGIEDIHYRKITDNKIKLLEKSIDYQVAYYVQGNLFNTYLLEGEPETKWEDFKKFNENSKISPALGFNFNTQNVLDEMKAIRNTIDVFGATLNSGTLNPDEFLPKLNDKLKKDGNEKIINEMQKQIDEYKNTKD